MALKTVGSPKMKGGHGPMFEGSEGDSKNVLSGQFLSSLP